MCCFPFRFEPFEVSAYLLAALAHHAVEPPELDHLTRHRVKGQAVPIQHLRKLRVGGDGRVSRARIAPYCRNSAAVSSARHFPAAHTRVPI